MASIKEQIKATGKLNVLVTGPDGKVKQDLFVPNLVVGLGKNYIATRMTSVATATAMNAMAVGRVSEVYNFGNYNAIAASNTFAPFTYNQSLVSEITSTNGGSPGRVSSSNFTTAIGSIVGAGTGGSTAVPTYINAAISTGSTSITINSGNSNVAAGMYIHGAGIPTNTRVGSSYAGSGATSVPLDFSLTSGITASATGTGTSGTNTIVVSSIAGSIVPGMLITGSASLPTGATVGTYALVSGNWTVTLASGTLSAGISSAVLTFASPTATGTDATYAIKAPVTSTSITLSTASRGITLTTTDAGNIQVGMLVTGTGISPGTYVYSVNSGTGAVTLTQYPTITTTNSSTLTFVNQVLFTNANTVTYNATFGPGTGTGSIVEAGIFNETSPTTSNSADSVGTAGGGAIVGGAMLCRTTFPVVTKGTDDTMSITWTVTIS